MKAITPAELQRCISAQPGLTLLDVRTPVEFAEVHVPEARNEPLDRLDPGNLPGTGAQPGHSPVYLICGSGAPAARAAELFARAGFGQTVVVEGGTLAWLQAGLPVTREAVKVMSLERQVRITAGLLVLAGVSLGCFVHPGFLGLAGFVGAGLVFAGITHFCGMGLLLATLPWNTRLKL